MFGLITRRRHGEELNAAKAEIQRQRRRAETAEDNLATALYNRDQVLKQNRDLDAATQRLHGRVEELKQRLDTRPASENADVARLEKRIARLRRIVSRLLEESRRDRRRADHLQKRLDDAVGLSPGRIAKSDQWQPGYQKPKPEAAS